MVGTTPCATYIERQKIKCFGHLVKIQQHQLPLQALYQRRSEVRARRHPRRRWTDNIRDFVEPHGITIISAKHRALDHQLLLPTTQVEDDDDDESIYQPSHYLSLQHAGVIIKLYIFFYKLNNVTHLKDQLFTYKQSHDLPRLWSNQHPQPRKIVKNLRTTKKTRISLDPNKQNNVYNTLMLFF
jgi:hypothetical protein